MEKAKAPIPNPDKLTPKGGNVYEGGSTFEEDGRKLEPKQPPFVKGTVEPTLKK